MKRLIAFATGCRNCSHEFLRGRDSCSRCRRSLEGFRLPSGRERELSAVRLVKSVFHTEAESYPGEERPLSQTLADWRDPLVLRIVAFVAAMMFLF